MVLISFLSIVEILAYFCFVEPKDILYLYQDQNEVGEVQDDLLKTFRTLGLTEMAELGSAISIEIDEKLYIPFYDLSLNTAELISQELEPIESYRYNAFGKEEIETQNESVINPWRFSSKRVDDETGYVYFGRRYYDSELGRWTTKDPKCHFQLHPMSSFLQKRDILTQLEKGHFYLARTLGCFLFIKM